MYVHVIREQLAEVPSLRSRNQTQIGRLSSKCLTGRAISQALSLGTQQLGGLAQVFSHL